MANKKHTLSNESEDLLLTFNTWSNSNWKNALNEHDDEIIKLVEKTKIFNIWTHALIKYDSAQYLLPEIFFDGYMSIHYACMGLYKYANMCSRSELENTLRLIYFSMHPIEYGWWQKEKSSATNPWKDWTYFGRLENVQMFNSKLTGNEKLEDAIHNSYRSLSSAVHTHRKSFQTSTGAIKPKYDKAQFIPWMDKFSEIQYQIHTILVLNFFNEYKNLGTSDKQKILDIGIDEARYNTSIKAILSKK